MTTNSLIAFVLIFQKLPKLLQNVKQENMEEPKVTLDQKLKKLKRQIDEDVSLARYKDILLKKKFGIDKEVKIVLDRIALEKVEEPFKENRKKYDYENYGLKKYMTKYKYDPKRVYDPSRPLKCRYCGLGYKRDFSLRFCEHQCSRDRAKTINSKAKIVLPHQSPQTVTKKIVIQSVTPECVTIVTPNYSHKPKKLPEVVMVTPSKPNEIATKNKVVLDTTKKVVTIVTPSEPNGITIQPKEPTPKPPRKSLPPLIPIKDSDDTSEEPKVPEEPPIHIIQLPSEPVMPTIQLPTEPIATIPIQTEPLPTVPLSTEPVLPLQSGPQWSFKCETCGELFKSEETLRTHEKYIHNLIRHNKVQSAIVRFNNTEDKIQCNICGEVFLSESSLRMHEKWIHNVNKDVIECPNCGLKMQHRKYLRRHLEKECTASSRPFKCPYCGADYRQKFSLTRHMQSQCSKAPNQPIQAQPVLPNQPIQAQQVLPNLPMEPLPIVYVEASSEPKVNQAQPTLVSPSMQPNVVSSTPSMAQPSRPFKCPYCPADYVHGRSLHRHINTQCTKAPKSNDGTEPLPIVYVEEEPKEPSEEPVIQFPMEPLPIVYVDSQSGESEEPMPSVPMENGPTDIEIKEELVTGN